MMFAARIFRRASSLAKELVPSSALNTVTDRRRYLDERSDVCQLYNECLYYQFQAKRAATEVQSIRRSRANRYLSSVEEKKTRERRDAIAQYYRDHDITEASQLQSNRLKAVALLYTGKLSADERYFFVCSQHIPLPLGKSVLQTTSKYLQNELPVRLAHQIKRYRKLPFIVATNPHILKVVSFGLIWSYSVNILLIQPNGLMYFQMELYIRSFKIISSYNGGKEIETMSEAHDFADLLEDLLNQHNTVIFYLSTGFR